jgi:hypothetical protein
VNAVTTRTGKSMQDPPYPQDAGTRWKTVTTKDTDAKDECKEEAEEPNTTANHEEIEEVPRASKSTTIQPPYYFRNGEGGRWPTSNLASLSR